MVDPEHAPVKEIILKDDVDLTKVPAAWTSELDPGPFIASGMAIIKDPDTGIRNMSIHRQQVMGKNRTTSDMSTPCTTYTRSARTE